MELLTIIILLAIVTLLLFAIEALITPGFGVAGICGAVCAVVANILTFIRYGNAIGMAVLGATVAVVIGFLYWLSRSRAIERATLHSTISSTAATPAQLSIKAGDEGRAETRLALIGNAVAGGVHVGRNIIGVHPRRHPRRRRPHPRAPQARKKRLTYQNLSL